MNNTQKILALVVIGVFILLAALLVQSVNDNVKVCLDTNCMRTK